MTIIAFILMFIFLALIIWAAHLVGVAFALDEREEHMNEWAQELADWEHSLDLRGNTHV